MPGKAVRQHGLKSFARCPALRALSLHNRLPDRPDGIRAPEFIQPVIKIRDPPGGAVITHAGITIPVAAYAQGSGKSLAFQGTPACPKKIRI